jgi:sugar/nucleoside kinase (ribokinase family)
MSRIVCLGSALQDMFLKDHDDFSEGTLPDGTSYFDSLKLGAKVDIDSIIFCVGGGGTNAAVTMARNGNEVFFIGNVGHDAPAMAVEMTLDAEGVKMDYMGKLSEKGTGYSVILLAPSGERTILTYRGASADFSGFEAHSLEEIRPDWIYATTLNGDMRVLEKFFAEGVETGARIMFNPGKAELEKKEELRELLKFVDILLVNKEEAAKIVVAESTEGLLRKLLEIVPMAIITDGKRGVMAGNPEAIYEAGIYSDVPMVDATGAGDAFGSGFLAQYLRTGSFRSAISFGSANSTSVVSRIGAKTGILRGDFGVREMELKEIKK